MFEIPGVVVLVDVAVVVTVGVGAAVELQKENIHLRNVMLSLKKYLFIKC